MPQAALGVAGAPATCCPPRFLGNRGGRLGRWALRTLLLTSPVASAQPEFPAVVLGIF